MAIASPDFIPMPWAAQGQTTDIPVAKPEMGRASWEEGFPPETAIPESAGGIPPHRLDMQGVLTSLSEHIFFQQSGSVYAWNSALNYNAGATVMGANGVKYLAVAESGPSSVAGSKNPTTDALFTCWKPFNRFLLDFMYPVGTIYMNATNMSPELIWGGSWRPLDQGRVLIGANSLYPAGSTGGSNDIRLTTAQLPAHSHTGSTATAGNHTHEATVANSGNHTHGLSIGNAGNHTHGESISTAGGHTHTRGTMNITGRVGAIGEEGTDFTSGAFYQTGEGGRGDNDGWDYFVYFDASRSWTGQTSVAGSHTHEVMISSAGNHTHTASAANAGTHKHDVTNAMAGNHTHAVTVGNTGQGQNFSIMQSYLAVYMWQRIA